jgi:alkaline phosphatase D
MPPPGVADFVKIGFGSCFNMRERTVETFQNRDPQEAPVSLPAHRIWERLGRDDLDAWCLIGDRYYLPSNYEDYAGHNREEILNLHLRMHETSLAIPGVTHRLSTAPTYVIYDDHDFGPNNSAWDFSAKDVAEEMARLTYAIPPRGYPGLPGVYYLASFGGVDAFFLDDRYHRNSAHRRDEQGRMDATPEPVRGETGEYTAQVMLNAMYGDGQMEWLRESLLASRADVKLIVGGNQMLSNIHPSEGWHLFHERADFLAWLRQAGVSGVIFIAGDRHHGSIGVLPEGGPYPLYEMTSSGLGVHLAPADDDTAASPYELLTTVSVPHYGVVEYDPYDGAGVVTLRLEGETGPLAEERIPVDRLRGP